MRGRYHPSGPDNLRATVAAVDPVQCSSPKLPVRGPSYLVAAAARARQAAPPCEGEVLPGPLSPGELRGLAVDDAVRDCGASWVAGICSPGVRYDPPPSFPLPPRSTFPALHQAARAHPRRTLPRSNTYRMLLSRLQSPRSDRRASRPQQTDAPRSTAASSRATVPNVQRDRCSACGVGCEPVPHDLLPDCPVCPSCFSACVSAFHFDCKTADEITPHSSAACRWCARSGGAAKSLLTCTARPDACASRGSAYCEQCVRRNFSAQGWREAQDAHAKGEWQCYACSPTDSNGLPRVGAKVAVTFEEDGKCPGRIVAVEGSGLEPGQFLVKFPDSDEPWRIDPSSGHVFEIVLAQRKKPPKGDLINEAEQTPKDKAAQPPRQAAGVSGPDGKKSKLCKVAPRRKTVQVPPHLILLHKNESYSVPLIQGPGNAEVRGAKLEKYIRKVVQIMPGQRCTLTLSNGSASIRTLSFSTAVGCKSGTVLELRVANGGSRGNSNKRGLRQHGTQITQERARKSMRFR